MDIVEIIGYTYRAHNYTPAALIGYMVHIRELSPAAIGMHPEEVLDQLAGAYCIDRDDEFSFDSDEFPKVIFKFMDADITEFVGYSDMPEYGIN